MKMPFGKHKDKELSEVPKRYLRWLRSQEWIGGWLATAVDQMLSDTRKTASPEVHHIAKPWEPSAE